ncbi:MULTISPECIES: phosphotransferase [Rhizobium]|uniref:Ser/Thr protein kinase RdoA (MazF antagonist) n=1 Tax=Rhizobium binae TaxID=1138190 RepID=A0ABV2MQD0_9HYPH|nr:MULTISPECIES: phosphotransferase [Rhizobium]MBX4911925.1 phosphotransferase [Rhizobium bangladeshense]MBX4938003.1 phosphotransferase [Rhizobium binae]MBX4944367.1 phosphotransferase [Rhizobium binae]MBX4980465.1 phosphotransferase [Rhizobium binae]MBX4995694.1 phosphotransferase [Rhizobium binae]
MTDFQTIIGRWLQVDPTQVQMVTDGVNKNLRAMVDHQDVFFRFSPASLHSKSDLEAEAAALKKLYSMGVPCCEIVEVDGRQIWGPVKVNEVEYNALVNRAIVGSSLAPVPSDAKAFGRSLGQLHQVSADLPIPRNVSTRKKRVDPVLQTVLHDLTELANTFEVNPEAEVGICHGDAWLGNAIMRENTAVLFDFEFMKFEALAYDIATFIWALRADNNEEEDQTFRSFVRGYREECNKEFSEGELKNGLLRKEINNIEFLCENVAMSREVKVATARFARDTIDFVLSDEFSRFRWV